MHVIIYVSNPFIINCSPSHLIFHKVLAPLPLIIKHNLYKTRDVYDSPGNRYILGLALALHFTFIIVNQHTYRTNSALSRRGLKGQKSPVCGAVSNQPTRYSHADETLCTTAKVQLIVAAPEAIGRKPP